MPKLTRILVAASLAAALVTQAQAQLRQQLLPLPAIPVQGLAQTVNQTSTSTLERLSDARRLEIARLIRGNRRVVDEDQKGNPIVRSEVLASAITDTAMLYAQSLGFAVAREQTLDSLGLKLVVLRAPDGLSTQKALSILRTADPVGVYDYNHIYSGSGATSPVEPAPLPAPAASIRADPLSPSSRMRIGLIDSGVNSKHAVFRDGSIHAWGCEGQWLPAAHGTAVASILVGKSGGFRGVQPDAELFSADVYCGRPTGGAVDALAGAFAWMVEQQVPVINVSLVGPANTLLERVVAALTAKGVLVVAAVGNDGPAAPPLYPASYPHVIGVTAVDAHQRVLIEAARGPQVMFASPGADLAAASELDAYASVRGTSFAAPIVAGMLAQSMHHIDPADAAAAIDDLAQKAVDLGPPGRDVTYGIGLVGSQFRAELQLLSHR